MNFAASWWREVRRIVLVASAAAGLGWLLGWPELSLMMAAAALICYWLYQFSRVSDWLRRPDDEPPEARGLWGEFFDRIYELQRHGREERDRLQTTVSYLRDSLSALKDGAIMIDADGGIEWSNNSASALLGLQYPRDRGQAILNLLRIPSFHAWFVAGDYQLPLQMESPLNPELSLQIEVTAFGRGSLLMFARDVTKMVRLEEMRRDFVANVSHELRSPLTVITGYLHTLCDMGLDEDKALGKPLLQMQQQAQRMEMLLKDLLWLSRLESLEGKEAYAEIDVVGLMAEVRDEAKVGWPDRMVTITPQSQVKLRGNYKQLHSALSNLVLNALKYSDGDVTVEWQQVEGAFHLSVSDSGPGIDAVHLPRLTERFYRVEQSQSQETGGTGLGLAIVKHVLAGHGAWLDIKSQPGVGSTFSCVFPLS